MQSHAPHETIHESRPSAAGRHLLDRPLLLFAVLCLFWAGFALIFAARSWLLRGPDAADTSFPRFALGSLGFFACYPPLHFLLFRLMDRLPLGPRRIGRTLLFHGIASITWFLAAGMYSTLWNLIYQGQGLDRYWTHFTALVASWSLMLDYFFYWLIAASVHLAQTMRKLHRRELEAQRLQLQASQLQQQLAQSQVQSLLAQLQPHFLFNTLNAVTALLRRGDTEVGIDMLTALSRLLRHLLTLQTRHFVRLEEELAFLRLYLSIEEKRFGDRLRTTWSIEPRAGEAFVPNMLLQPLVENAVRHGIAHNLESGELRIAATVDDDRLRLDIFNEGPLLEPEREPHGTGIGVPNTRRRLQQIYGDRATLTLANRDGIGVAATITMPLDETQPWTAEGFAN